MSQGNGAFGDRNSTSGTCGAQYGANPIRSLPSAPSPCSRITRRFALPPECGGCDGPDRVRFMLSLSAKFLASFETAAAQPPQDGDDLLCHKELRHGEEARSAVSNHAPNRCSLKR